jgi:hypothetical protein
MEAIGFPGYKRFLLNICEIITLRISSYCFGVSEYVCSWSRVQKYANNCLGHVYNLSKPIAVQEISSFRKEMNINDSDVIITSTGRIVKDKGFDILEKVDNE